MKAPIEINRETDFNNPSVFLHKKPYDIYYQTVYASSWSPYSLSFDISAPGFNYLLHRDIWIEYTVYITENTPRYFSGQMEDETGITITNPDVAAQVPNANSVHNGKCALRGGNVMARTMSLMEVTINGKVFTFRPATYMDVLNRLYVSNKGSEVEFGESGGEFDSGNHGHRTEFVTYRNQVPNQNHFLDDWKGIENKDPDESKNSAIQITLSDGFNTNDSWDPTRDLWARLKPDYPLTEKYYNPGYSKRYAKFMNYVRDEYQMFYDPKAAVGEQLLSVIAPRIGISTYKIKVRERIPCPIFKMYEYDGVMGVLPNVSSLRFRIEFIHNFLSSIFHINDHAANPFYIDWENVESRDIKILLKWYSMFEPLPQTVQIKIPHIITREMNVIVDSSLTNFNNDQAFSFTSVHWREVTFPIMPDLLLIYVLGNINNRTHDTPDDTNLTIQNFNMAINQQGGKLSCIDDFQVYQLWKRNLKYKDDPVPKYEEWRQYCCVVALKPEDYGMRKLEDFNKPVFYEFKFDAVNTWINPSIWNQPAEPLIGTNGGENNFHVFVQGIYYRSIINFGRGEVEQILQGI